MTTTPKQYWIRFDPRTKVILLLLCVLSASMAPNTDYVLGLILLISIFALFCKRVSMAIYGIVIYLIFYALSLTALSYLDGFMQTTLIAFLGLVHKIYPCAFICNVIIKTTKVSEFISAMNKFHMPKTLTIPLAIMLRYIPTIQEDWCFIKDAMRLRDVSPTLYGLLTRPIITIECVYVPLMMLASKAADDLSIASITRGIENPQLRTSYTEIRFHFTDFIILPLFITYFIAAFFI